MTAYVALLRGINLGKRQLKMEALRAWVADVGWEDVATYIASGNVVFRGKKQSSTTVAADLEDRISAEAGFDVPVVVRTHDEMQAVVDEIPFATKGAEAKTLHVVFLRDKPKKTALDAIDLAAFAPEEAALGRREVYLHLPNGMGRSKLAVALTDKALANMGTVRNWNTVTKLTAMAADLA